jgi:hypothetical protein
VIVYLSADVVETCQDEFVLFEAVYEYGLRAPISLFALPMNILNLYLFKLVGSLRGSSKHNSIVGRRKRFGFNLAHFFRIIAAHDAERSLQLMVDLDKCSSLMREHSSPLNCRLPYESSHLL